MAVFRKKLPKRRTGVENVSDYKKHRDILREDFNHRCGYCDDSDNFRRTHYEIDHFVPKRLLKGRYSQPDEYKSKEQEYSNLVYACRSCNNAKGEKWPTEDIDVSSKENKGFIDPCKFEYDDQFSRNENGEIIPKTDLGRWLYTALKLEKPEHMIIWHLDELDHIIQETEQLMGHEGQTKKCELIKRHYHALFDFRKYYKQLMGY